MKNLVKRILQLLMPRQYSKISSARSNKYAQRILAENGVPEIADLFVKKHGAKIQSGPFMNMVYIDSAIGSSFIPKLVGSYESELSDVMGGILKTSYDAVVDVGCAEGYYAVGLAMKLPGNCRVYAFDTDESAQKMCRELAIKNSVQDRVKISGYCDANHLESMLQGRCLVVCDCEGYEVHLLDPAIAPSLCQSEILVELHEDSLKTVKTSIVRRFSNSHHIQIIDSSPRDPSDYPSVHFLSPEQQKVALSEFRGSPQQWAYMTPNAVD